MEQIKMRTFKQHTINEGQLRIDMKKMDRGDKKEFIKLLQSLKIKREFDLSLASVSIDRWLSIKAYYLDLDKLQDYLKDKGYNWKGDPKSRSSGRDSEITMENFDEANNKTAFVKRVKDRFPAADSYQTRVFKKNNWWNRIVQVVKPKNNISSKRYVELGKIFDTGNFAKFQKALRDMEKKDGIK
jgi:hypothetical protein